MVATSTTASTDKAANTISRQDAAEGNSENSNYDEGQQIKRDADPGLGHYGANEEKLLTIVKKIPVPIQITKHIPYPVEKLVPVPV